MEGELFGALYHTLRRLPAAARRKRQQHSDAKVVAVYFWAVLHDRPVSWACEARHWPGSSPIVGALPSPSTMTRRLRTDSVRRLMGTLELVMSPQQPALCKYLDGKPLPVGGCSKDKDAKVGWGAGRKNKGYKLHVIVDAWGQVYGWRVEPMNVAETAVARTLIGQLTGCGYLVADKAYDAWELYDLCRAHDHQLVAPPRQANKGYGRRSRSPSRHRCIDILTGDFGRTLVRDRKLIERYFGQLTSFPGGLGPLPSWVRTLERVRRWVQAKLILNALRMCRKQSLAA